MIMKRNSNTYYDKMKYEIQNNIAKNIYITLLKEEEKDNKKSSGIECNEKITRNEQNPIAGKRERLKSSIERLSKPKQCNVVVAEPHKHEKRKRGKSGPHRLQCKSNMLCQAKYIYLKSFKK